MNLEEYKSKKEEMVLECMWGFLNDFEEDGEDAGYTKEDVEKCGSILDEYIDKLMTLDKNEPNFMQAIKWVVLELNALDEKTEGSLIETGQREDLYTFITEAAADAGFILPDEDVTEEWREW